jgi:hypothetical protein
MQTWIFQGNPDDYDIDGYLASRPSQVVWLVTRYASEIAPGDRVYLWRNRGQAKAVAGFIAETIVSEAPTLRGEDSEGVAFWRESSQRATGPQVRAVLRLIRVALPREVLRRDWMLDDPILKELPNLKMKAGRTTGFHPSRPVDWTHCGARRVAIGHAMKRSLGCGRTIKPTGAQYQNYLIRPWPM